MSSSRTSAALALMVTCALWACGCEETIVVASDAAAETDAGAPAADAGACVPQCDARCGMPDGCGGMCEPCGRRPSCSCDGRVCGDDGCGGSCGACEGTESCSAHGARCDCGDATVTYALVAPDVDWQETGRIVVTLRQRFAREAEPTSRSITLDRYSPEAELTFEGACAPDLEVRWVYVSRWRDPLGRALHCEGDVLQVQDRTTIELPAGTGGACRPG